MRIVRKIAQYFYPQRQTQVMNEGWATFWHYTLMNDLYDEGLVTEGFMMEFLQSHTSVVFQPGFDSPYYSGINPYALGFAMYTDIRRMCEHPTEEDRRWFPDIAGSDWLSTLKFAMSSFKDESFILQYLSPKVIRDLKLFSIRMTTSATTCWYRRSTTKLATGSSESNWPPSTTWAIANPTCRSGASTVAATAP